MSDVHMTALARDALIAREFASQEEDNSLQKEYLERVLQVSGPPTWRVMTICDYGSPIDHLKGSVIELATKSRATFYALDAKGLNPSPSETPRHIINRWSCAVTDKATDRPNIRVVAKVIETPPVAQGKLPLPQSFSPTHALVDFWLDGIAALSTAADRPEFARRIEKERGRAAAQHQFVQLLEATFTSIAQKARYRRKRDERITLDHRFVIGVQTEICDRIFVIPDQSSYFLERLSLELRSAVKDGADIKGAWGRIELNPKGDLKFNFNATIRESDPGFLKARVIE